MSNVWDRLKLGAKPVNRLAKAVARKADIDDLPPADRTIRYSGRGKEWREGYESGLRMLQHGSETDNPYQGSKRSDWFDGFDEAAYQLQQAHLAKR